MLPDFRKNQKSQLWSGDNMTIELKINDNEQGLLFVGHDGRTGRDLLYFLKDVRRPEQNISVLDPEIIGGRPDTLARKDDALLIALGKEYGYETQSLDGWVPELETVEDFRIRHSNKTRSVSLVKYPSREKSNLPKPPCERIDSLTFSGNSLYYLSGHDYRRIIDATTAKELKRINGSVEALATHDGKLYCSTGNAEQRYASGGEIIEVESRKVVARRDGSVIALASHNGDLYDVTFYSGWRPPLPWMSTIRKTFSGEAVAHREGWTRGLISFNGTLLDYGLNGLFDTFSDKNGKYPIFESQIYHGVSLNKKLWDYFQTLAPHPVRE